MHPLPRRRLAHSAGPPRDAELFRDAALSRNAEPSRDAEPSRNGWPPRDAEPSRDAELFLRAVLPRRGILWGLSATGAAAVTLAGCGPVRLGQPTPQTPPAPGIDELYRLDLITALERAVAACVGIPVEQLGDPELPEVLEQQRAAMRTGAEAEEEAEAETSSSAASADGGTQGTPADLMDALAALTQLGTDAARQTSSHLASPVSAIAARAGWAAGRLSAVTGEPLTVHVPQEREIVPKRQVPATDPPSTDATPDLATLLGPVQENELYAAYVREVLAARTEDEQTRDRLMTLVDDHRERAARLADLARSVQDAEVVAQDPVAPLPSGMNDTVRTEQMLDLSLLEQHVQLVGAMAAEQRPLSIRAALVIGGQLVRTAAQLPPLPGLTLPADG